jgi:integrase
MQLTAIDAEMVSDFEAKLLGGTAGLEPRTKQSPKSARNILQLLHKILKDAKTDGYLRLNPMADLELIKLEDKEERAISYDEARKLLEQCAGNDTLHLVVLLALLAGLRRNEIFALRSIDIDWTADLIRVRQNLFWRHGKYQNVAKGEPRYIFGTPKTKRSVRNVDMSPAIKNALRKYRLQSKDKDGLIFQSRNGGPLDPKNFTNRILNPAIEQAQALAKKIDKNSTLLEGVTLHTLRHTFGSWKLEEGCNVVYVSKQMGHARVSITANVYAHLVDESKPEATAKTDSLLFPATPAAIAETAATMIN